MNEILRKHRGLSVLVDLNWDRVIFIFTILLALGAGAWVGGH